MINAVPAPDRPSRSRPPPVSHPRLRIILALTGLAIVWLGANVGLGGMTTLGWQGSADFLRATDPARFAVQDSHIRFLGGFWFAAGLLVLAGAFALERLRPALVAVVALVFIGGLIRLAQGDPSVLLGPAVAPSLVAELVLFPLLALWIHRTGLPAHG